MQSPLHPDDQARLDRPVASRDSITYGLLAAVTDPDDIVASGSTVIEVGANNTLEVCLQTPDIECACVITVTEYSDATPAVGNQIRTIEKYVGSGDLKGKIDRSTVGLAAGTFHKQKNPIRFTVTPYSYVMITVGDDGDADWYVKYELFSNG